MNDIIRINEDNVYDLIDAAIATQGEDFVYNVTGYGAHCQLMPLDPALSFDPDIDPRVCSGCLVGVALKLAGVPDEVLTAADLNGTIEDLYEEQLLPGVDITPSALAFLKEVQWNQDEGLSWGDSRDLAKEELERRSRESSSTES